MPYRVKALRGVCTLYMLVSLTKFINLIRQPNNSKSVLLEWCRCHSGKMFNLYTIADGCYNR